MAASVQFRPQSRDLGMVMREVDEDLAIFLGMRNCEKERNDHLLVEESHEFDDSKCPETKPDSLLTLDASQPEIVLNAAHDKILNLEIEKSDYNWFLTQPDSSLLPLDMQCSAVDQANKTSDGDGISSKSELVEECSPLSNNSSIQPATPTNEDSSTAANRKPLSSSVGRKPAPRSATPTGRSGSSTPSKPTSRSSTPSKTSVRAVISKSKPSLATSTDRPSSGRKMGPTMCRNPVPFRGASPTVRSRPSKPSEMLSVSQDAPQNPKVSMANVRPASASRGRVSSTHSSSCNEKPRQRSCSPPKVRAPISRASGKNILSRSRGCNDDGDDVNPVVMGAKMVDRVVSMRKLAPPKQDDDYVLSHDHNPKKSSSGFGRSLSKKSLDMAIRHMDIRRSIPDNKLRPIPTGKSSAAGLSESSN